MAYGIKYRADYDNIAGVTCRVEILEKDYTGSILPLELSGTPVKQKYQTDEPYPAIKGCSLTLQYNNTGNTPLTDFYSPNDDQFKIKHYKAGVTTFEGFLVQDDCSELMVDYRHDVTLSANDNLGLLKDVPLDAQPVNIYKVFETAAFATIAPHTITVAFYNFVPKEGEVITLDGTTVDGNYTVVSGSYAGPVLVIIVSETVGNVGTQIGNWFVYGAMDFHARNNLLSIIYACLVNTGLELECVAYTNLFETRQQTTNSFLQQTYIDTETFLSDTTFKNCWDILEQINNRFKLTLFQSGGRWCIVRWAELRYGQVDGSVSINGFVYNNSGRLTGTEAFTNADSFGINAGFGFSKASYPENAPTRSISRPFKYDKETFNYIQPKYLLKNYDLLKLGALIRTYTSGSDTISEYSFAEWFDYYAAPPNDPEYYIRVVTDTATGDEKNRYVVVTGSPFDNARSIQATPFEVSAGDRLQLDFTFITTASQAGPGNITLALRLFDGTTNKYASSNPSVGWDNSPAWVFSIPSGADTNQSQSVTIKTSPIPFDGFIYVYLPQADLSAGAGDETQIRDIRLTYLPYINDSVKVTGQTHSNEQPVSIKNNEDEIIYLDDSPRSPNAGCLFLSSYTGILQNRTALWFRSVYIGLESLRLGQIITFEQLFNRRIPRSKIEGTFIGLQGIALLKSIIYDADATKQYIFGSLEIDFKNNSFDCTLWQVVLNEIDSDLDNTYTFNYLYSTK